MIRTKRFKYTPKELFSLLITLYFKKSWWVYVLVLILVMIMTEVDNQESLTLFLGVFTILYPFFYAIQLWKFVKSKSNKLLSSERLYEIDNEKIQGIFDEVTHSTIKLDHFIKVEFISNTYLLFLSKSQFIYIPVESFEQESDRMWFDAEVISKVKNRLG